MDTKSMTPAQIDEKLVDVAGRIAQTWGGAEEKVLRAEEAQLEAEYAERNGWNRYFAVPSGHIHSSMTCETCNKDGKQTRFHLIVKQSGSEAQDVADAESLPMCQVCFPGIESEVEDDTVCAGSGEQYHDDLPNRAQFAVGRDATCHHCYQTVVISKYGKLRKHNKEA